MKKMLFLAILIGCNTSSAGKSPSKSEINNEKGTPAVSQIASQIFPLAPEAPEPVVEVSEIASQIFPRAAAASEPAVEVSQIASQTIFSEFIHKKDIISKKKAKLEEEKKEILKIDHELFLKSIEIKREAENMILNIIIKKEKYDDKEVKKLLLKYGETLTNSLHIQSILEARNSNLKRLEEYEQISNDINTPNDILKHSSDNLKASETRGPEPLKFLLDLRNVKKIGEKFRDTVSPILLRINSLPTLRNTTVDPAISDLIYNKDVISNEEARLVIEAFKSGQDIKEIHREVMNTLTNMFKKDFVPTKENAEKIDELIIEFATATINKIEAESTLKRLCSNRNLRSNESNENSNESNELASYRSLVSILKYLINLGDVCLNKKSALEDDEKKKSVQNDNNEINILKQRFNKLEKEMEEVKIKIAKIEKN